MSLNSALVRFGITIAHIPLTNRLLCNRSYRVRQIAYTSAKSLFDRLLESLTNMLTPGQIANSLSVSTATVRRWSLRFARHLSPQTPNHKRTYTPEDLAVLARVRDLSATGSPLDQIDRALSVSAQSADPSTALITLTDFAQSLQFARDSVASLQTQIDKQNAQIKAIADWFALPFYKRLFAKPPRLDK